VAAVEGFELADVKFEPGLRGKILEIGSKIRKWFRLVGLIPESDRLLRGREMTLSANSVNRGEGKKMM
jgi:hypothetical protein